MNRRLLQFLQAENITQSQFADTLSVARGSVSHILAGRNRPGYDFLESLALHYPSLNIEWLLTGKGKMLKDVSPMQEETPSLFAENPVFASESAPEREISRIIVYYSDNTFKEFIPGD